MIEDYQGQMNEIACCYPARRAAFVGVVSSKLRRADGRSDGHETRRCPVVAAEIPVRIQACETVPGEDPAHCRSLVKTVLQRNESAWAKAGRCLSAQGADRI
jgi:hypothetical protein